MVNILVLDCSLPPVAVKQLLIEDRPVGADEGDGVHEVVVDGVDQADVVLLALHLGVGIVAWGHITVYSEVASLH